MFALHGVVDGLWSTVEVSDGVRVTWLLLILLDSHIRLHAVPALLSVDPVRSVCSLVIGPK